MRSSTLITLLPLLAVTAINAHPHHRHHHDQHDDESISTHHHHHHHTVAQKRQSRKSIAFGPSHVNAEYQVVDSAITTTAITALKGTEEDLSPMEMKKEWANKVHQVLKAYKGFKGEEGVDWVIREDSYKDPRTGLTHIYVKQLVNGLQVIDGDLNLNLGRDGQVLGWGCNFFQGPTPTHPALGEPKSDFISSLLSNRIRRHPAHRHCEDLTSKIEANEKRVRKLRKMLRKIQKAEGGGNGSGSESDEEGKMGLKGLVKGALRIVREMILGGFSSPHHAEEHHPTKLDKMMHKVQEKFGVNSLDQLEIKLAHMARHLDHMKDQAGVICAAPEYVDENSIKADEYVEGLVFHSPGKAFAKLIHHLSPSPHLLPSEEILEKTIKWDSDEPSLYGESTEHILTGVPGLEQGGATGEVKSRLVYHQTNTPDGKGMDLRLVWRFVVEMKENWYEASVDVEDLRVVGVVDWASEAPPQAKKRLSKGGKQKPLPVPHKAEPYSYTVFPFGVNDPSVGNLSSEHAPWDTIASPAGWHSFPDSKNPWARQSIPGMKTGQTGPFVNGSRFAEEYEEASAPGNGTKELWSTFMTTMGNNVLAQEDWEGASNWLHNDRPVNSSYIFDYEYGEPDGLRPKEYIDLAVTQLFYTSNMYHDLLHRLGFDEVSGNFQMDNFGRGGLGGDAVICQAQDGSGTDNANFMTPPDGSQPRMRMYVWDTATPFRDGDLEAGIVIHEYSHGLSTRLTGGPANSGCLGYGEAGGMGEGWGDAFATLIRQVAEYGKHEEEYGMGSWAANRKSGIRNFVYSANMTSNPSTFKTLDKPGYWGVHAIGEVWAEMLFVVVERLIEKHGFSKTLFPPLVPSEDNDYYWPQQYDSKGRPLPLVPRHGNSLLAHLLVQGMKLQPCRPTFANARDAILQADVVLTGGNNTCDIWQGFAERGLGVDAKTLGQLPWGGGVRSEDYTVPKACMGKPEPKPKKPKH